MFGLNKNIWILVLAQPFAQGISAAIVLTSGLIGMSLAPSPALATLPLTIMVSGMALGALPAGLFM